MKKAIIIGGSRGIGFALLNQILDFYDEIFVVDLAKPSIDFKNVTYFNFDLSKDNPFKLKEVLQNADALFITAGIGRVNNFETFSIEEIEKTIDIDFTSIIKILRIYYTRMLSKDSYCLVMGSLAGELNSPLFAIYAACKAGINNICRSLNIELEKKGTKNRITNIMPISFSGSSFNGGNTDLNLLTEISKECLNATYNRLTEYIPNSEICKDILKRNQVNSHDFGISSYEYKIQNNRLSDRKLIIIGYLSGTFDLFHVGHLNLLRRAKQYCDYLVVGVHKDASHKGKTTYMGFDERKEIVSSCKFVDQVIEAPKEDSDAWNQIHYDYLFVGSDYKGTERFERYEKMFKNTETKIIYFSYTQGISSTVLRDKIGKK